MARWQLGDEQSENACLNALPAEAYRRVTSFGEVVELQHAQILDRVGEPIASAWFPLTAIISLQRVLQLGGAVEIAMAGREGMLGVSLFLDARHANAQSVVQIGGTALRIDAQAFRQLLRDVAPFRDLVRRYTDALLFVTGQNLACVRSHSISQRTARWLLITQDRIGSDRFDLTQDLLGQMLQVRRQSVSEAQSRLQQGGYIRYSRGNVEILDREGLETLTCECYRAIRTFFEERVHI